MIKYMMDCQIVIQLFQQELMADQMNTGEQPNVLGYSNASNRRAKQLSDQIEKTTTIFSPSNFLTLNKNIDVHKLKNRINEAKKKLLANKTKKQQKYPIFNVQNVRAETRRQKIYIDEEHQEIRSKANSLSYSKQNKELSWRNDITNKQQSLGGKRSSMEKRTIKSEYGHNGHTSELEKKYKTHESQLTEELLLPQCKFKRPDRNSRFVQIPYNKKTIMNRNSKSILEKQKKKRRRLATDLGSYEQRNSSIYNSTIYERKRSIDHSKVSHKKTSHMLDKTSIFRQTRVMNQNKGRNSHRDYGLSQLSAQLLSSRKILISQPSNLQQFEKKILILWNLYEQICLLTEEIGIKGYLTEQNIKKYMKNVTSEKFEFIYDLCQYFQHSRTQRTIKMSRILEFFSIFEICLSGLDKKKMKQAQIVNFLGYSSSSVVFLVKLLFLTHETPLIMSNSIMEIRNSIVEFQEKSYKAELRNVKEILRRLQHNNEIISMLKIRCARKHGKYCEQFINQTLKNFEKQRIPLFQTANNIFEFLSFYLHYENIAYKLPLIARPPTPFLFLKYPRSIVIEPWGVLAYKKHDKVVIRAHTTFILSKILNTSFVGNIETSKATIDSRLENLTVDLQNYGTIEKQPSKQFNLIFWTELMPKQADFLASLFPQGDNVYWLYRYHCEQEAYQSLQKKRSHKKLANETKQSQSYNCIKNLDHLGCIPENTIIIDNNEQSYKYHPQNGINMVWKGEKKDTRLIKLWDLISKISQSSTAKHSSLLDEMKLHLTEIDQLENAGAIKKFRRNNFSKN